MSKVFQTCLFPHVFLVVRYLSRSMAPSRVLCGGCGERQVLSGHFVCHICVLRDHFPDSRTSVTCPGCLSLSRTTFSELRQRFQLFRAMGVFPTRDQIRAHNRLWSGGDVQSSDSVSPLSRSPGAPARGPATQPSSPLSDYDDFVEVRDDLAATSGGSDAGELSFIYDGGCRTRVRAPRR